MPTYQHTQTLHIPGGDGARIDRIKAIDILTVIHDCGQPLRRSGSKYKTLCPWHADRSLGSFVVYPQNNSCACFSCGHGGSVIDYYMAEKGVDFKTACEQLQAAYIDSSEGATRAPQRLYREPETLHIRLDAVRTTLAAYEQNTLLQYLSTIYSPADVVRTAREYLVGTARDGSAIFWYKAFGENAARTAKIMRYLPDGHRDKSRGATWLHALFTPYEKTDKKGNILYTRPPRLDITRWSTDPSHTADGRDTEWKARCTLFGEHLLHDPARANIPVCIVESEKSAIICALHEPRFLWLATGGKKFLREDRIAALQLQHREVILVPDRDALYDQLLHTNVSSDSKQTHIDPSWETVASSFSYRDHISICRDVEGLAKELDVTDPKCDIADLYLLQAQHSKAATSNA